MKSSNFMILLKHLKNNKRKIDVTSSKTTSIVTKNSRLILLNNKNIPFIMKILFMLENFDIKYIKTKNLLRFG